MMTMPKMDPHAARDALGHFATAFVFLILGLAGLVWASPLLAEGLVAHPRVIGGLHFLTLGWLSLSIFGAFKVFMGVALGSSSYGTWLGRAVWILWSFGTVAFASGLILQVRHLIICGLISLLLGLISFTVHYLPALIFAKRGQMTRIFLAFAIFSLWCTWIMGAGAGFLRAGWVAWPLPAGYLQAHILLAVFGWVGATVVGVGSHLIPMFALSNNPKQWPVKVALPFWIAIPILALLGAFMPQPFLTLGWISAGIGSLLWGLQVSIYFSAKIRKEKDGGLFIAAGATVWLILAWTLILIRSIGGFGNSTSFIGALLVGWLTVFTLGIYHRVVPFLVWLRRFSDKAGRGPVVRIKDLTSERLIQFTIVLSLGGVSVWIVGLVFALEPLIYFGSTSLLAGSVSALGQIPILYGWKQVAPTPPKPPFQKIDVQNMEAKAK